MDIQSCTLNAHEVISALENEKTLILATCANHRVTTRHMSHVNEGLDIYFQTGRNYLKSQQIAANPNVAVSVGTFDIEGIATLHDHPLDAKNQFFIEKMKVKHPNAVERWSPLAEEVVIKITVTTARRWRYVNNAPYLDEYYSPVSDVPEWREEMKIGKPITTEEGEN
ncbi:MAG: pyridoxamine 5'-phosphate oxidase family protein [Defluviitaleaceae bacterium]|nr:pyridoxamine 5'-phosphate oxidase family protein [Defluviitaleaceae bacterium]MCL2274593.1 pyridoxamine 5'-phosphate oxidase family protein [Defluviitaleaceae bacterium]